MIQSARVAQRADIEAFAGGLRAWLVGDDTIEGDAAGMTLAEILLMHRQSLVKS